MKSKGLHYLIPVDFSGAAYRAAQYALLLARKTGGQITLVHVFEANHLSDSVNPVVLTELVKRTEEIKKRKLKGLQDIIKISGIHVDIEILRGHFPQVLIGYVSQVRPDVMVVARKSTNYSQLIMQLLQDTSPHLLIFPDSSHPETPQRALIAADLSDTSNGLDMLVRLLVSMEQELALVHTDVAQDEAALQDKIIGIQKKFGVEARLIKYRQPVRSHDILLTLKRNPADWLCVVKKKGNWLTRMFSNIRQEDITTQAEVPVLVFRE